jgi:hypothetical protein
MRTLTVLTFLAASLPLAACGSSSSNATGATQAASSNYARALQFASCVRSHGVPNFPDPKSNESGDMRIQVSPGNARVNGVSVNGPAFQAAMKACQSKLPNGGKPPPLSANRRNAMLKFSQCMRAHGVTNFPDPTFSGNGIRLELSKQSGIDPNSPTFKAAQNACGSRLALAKGGP